MTKRWRDRIFWAAMLLAGAVSAGYAAAVTWSPYSTVVGTLAGPAYLQVWPPATGTVNNFIAVGTLTSYTIGGLPTCNAGAQGQRVYVTNGATSPTYLATVSTTGAVIVPVFCNGTNWVYN